MKAVAKVLGVGGTKAPVTSTAPVEQVDEEKKKAKKLRSALLETPGGIVGAELQPGQVSQRDTLFGN
jgi:hypothetical protein